MIARVIAVDPTAREEQRADSSDLLVYQIAGERHLQLFLECFEKAGVQVIVVESAPSRRRKKS